jgi:2-isopropylmalate synthase
VTRTRPTIDQSANILGTNSAAFATRFFIRHSGPVDATFNCIKALVPHDATLELYQVHAVTEGTDAQAEVSVRLSENGKSVTAKGADPDTLVASANAYLGALNKLMVKRQRGKPEAMVVP